MPIIGEKFDGHDYINEIFSKRKNTFSFCQKDRENKVKEEYKKNLILVEDTLLAYHKIANYYRKKVNPKVIAITGSTGKTTTKEIVSSVISSKFKIHKTNANFNNEIGVPKTILEMEEDAEVLILEMAMRGRNQISLLSKTAEPDIAIITNVGTAHIGILGNEENIIKAKCEILEFLKQDGLAIVHENQNLLKQVKSSWSGKLETFSQECLKSISYSEGRSKFKYENKEYFINALGFVYILNSIVSILIAKELKLSDDEIQKGLSSFSVPEGRGNLIKLNKNICIIDDSYNANPDSVKSSVNNLIDCFDKEYRRIFILGELAELGEYEKDLLKEIGEWLSKKDISYVITVGNKLEEINKALKDKAKIATNVEDCCNILNNLIEGKTVISIKGSRVAGLEKIIDFLVKSYKEN